MANKSFKKVQAVHRDLILLSGRVILGASGAVSSQSGRSGTVTKADTGKYTITFRDNYPAHLGGSVNLVAASGATVFNAYLSDLTITGATPTATIYTVSGSTITNPASGTELHWFVRCLNTDDEV